jgi:hypothetical protein
MDIKTEVYALETAKSSVQDLGNQMTSEIMKGIAKKYVDEKLIAEVSGQDAITITYPTDVYVAEVDDEGNVTNKPVSAIITYNSAPEKGEPRVKLQPSWISVEESGGADEGTERPEDPHLPI